MGFHTRLSRGRLAALLGVPKICSTLRSTRVCLVYLKNVLPYRQMREPLLIRNM